MAFSSAPTLCEVTYDITDEEKRYTPFRYQCRSAPTQNNRANTPGGYSEITNYSLPSGLTKTYRHCSSAQPSSGGSRVGTSVSNTLSDCSSRKTGRPRTALPYVSPTLPTVPQSPRTKEEYEEGPEHLSDDKLVWVDALNKWIPENQLNSRPYVSFVGTAPTVEKLYSSLREQQRQDGLDSAWCDRYDEHMKSFDLKAKQGSAPKQLQPEHSFIKRVMALKKKEALRKKAMEQLEQRRLKKATMPVHAVINERRQKVRFQMPTPTKVSPRSPRESIVKKEQDFQKAWDDEVNTEDVKTKDIVEDETDTKDLSSTAELEMVVKEEEVKKKEPKPPEKSQAEIDAENARKLQASMAAKNKKQVIQTPTKIEPPITKKEAPPPPPKVEPEIVEEPPPPRLPTPQPPVKPIKESKPLPSEPVTRPTKGEPKKVKKVPKKEPNTKPAPENTDVKPSRSKSKSLTKVKSKSKDHVIKDEKVDLEECGTLISEDTSHSVATIEDTKTGPLSLTVSRTHSPEETPPQTRRRSVVKKAFLPKVKVKVERAESTPSPTEEEIKPVTPEPEEPEVITEIEIKEPELPVVELDEPPLPDPSLLKCKDSKSATAQRSTLKPVLKLEQKLKKQRQFKRDTSYEEELRRQEEAERRRQKQMEMLERMKQRKNRAGGDLHTGDEAKKFDNYFRRAVSKPATLRRVALDDGFLAKYCIFNKSSMEAYRRTFESVDEEKRGWIQGVEVMIALRGINQKISYSEEEYLYRVLELTGYNVSQGADFKLFAVMAALSLKISALDSWMKNMIGSMDFKTLDTKMYMCKKLWECNVDPDTNKISLDQLCIELRAGGISHEHEVEVREKLGHLKALDLLDFLTYIPLFIMIHESVVDNPFDERREK